MLNNYVTESFRAVLLKEINYTCHYGFRDGTEIVYSFLLFQVKRIPLNPFFFRGSEITSYATVPGVNKKKKKKKKNQKKAELHF